MPYGILKDLLYFIFINDKYFIIIDYFILHSNISLFIPINSNLTAGYLLIYEEIYDIIKLVMIYEY
jgi:hypothetical protein